MSIFLDIEPVPFRLLDDLMMQMEANNDRLRLRLGDKGSTNRPAAQSAAHNAEDSTYRRPEPAAHPRVQMNMAYAYIGPLDGTPETYLYSTDGTAQVFLDEELDEEGLLTGPRYMAFPAGNDRLLFVRALWYRPPGRLEINPFWIENPPTDFSAWSVKFDVWLVGMSAVKKLTMPPTFETMLGNAFRVEVASERRASFSVLGNFREIEQQIPLGVEADFSYWSSFGATEKEGNLTFGLVVPSTPMAFNNLEVVQEGFIVKRSVYDESFVTTDAEGNFSSREDIFIDRPYLVHPATHFTRKDLPLGEILATGVGLGIGRFPAIPGLLRWSSVTEGFGMPRVVSWEISKQWPEFTQDILFASDSTLSLRQDVDYELGNAFLVGNYPFQWTGANFTISQPESTEENPIWKPIERFTYEWPEGQAYAATDWGKPGYCRGKLLSYGFLPEDLIFAGTP